MMMMVIIFILIIINIIIQLEINICCSRRIFKLNATLPTGKTLT